MKMNKAKYEVGDRIIGSPFVIRGVIRYFSQIKLKANLNLKVEDFF